VLDYTGLTLEEVQREDFPARIFHPEDVERLLEKRNETLARGKPFEVEKRELGKDVSIAGFLSATIPFATTRAHYSMVCDWDGYRGSQASRGEHA